MSRVQLIDGASAFIRRQPRVQNDGRRKVDDEERAREKRRVQARAAVLRLCAARAVSLRYDAVLFNVREVVQQAGARWQAQICVRGNVA